EPVQHQHQRPGALFQVGESQAVRVHIVDLVSGHITAPPLTPRTWPVMYPASSEQRKPTAAAMSSAVPTWPTGMRCASCSSVPNLPSACAWRDIGVSMLEGGTLLTVMPFEANSLARDFVNVMTPPLDAV